MKLMLFLGTSYLKKIISEIKCITDLLDKTRIPT